MMVQNEWFTSYEEQLLLSMHTYGAFIGLEGRHEEKRFRKLMEGTYWPLSEFWWSWTAPSPDLALANSLDNWIFPLQPVPVLKGQLKYSENCRAIKISLDSGQLLAGHNSSGHFQRSAEISVVTIWDLDFSLCPSTFLWALRRIASDNSLPVNFPHVCLYLRLKFPGELSGEDPSDPTIPFCPKEQKAVFKDNFIELISLLLII